ncbi:MAG: phosphatase PAP2 family protein [Myxococcales bacterium]
MLPAVARTSLLVALLAFAPKHALGAGKLDQRHYDLQNTSPTALLGESAVALGMLGGAWAVTGGPSARCWWCNSNGFDESLRNLLRANDPGPPALISHALSMGAIPAMSLIGLVGPAALDQHWQRGLEDSWILANTILVTTAIGDLVKHSIARERPSFHHRVESVTEFATWPEQRNKSYFSLDTAWAFAIVSSAATLAYSRGYSTAPVIAAGGGVLAFGAGMLRIVGDAHWTTDVLSGAVIGTGIGIALPLLVHARQGRDATTMQSPQASASQLVTAAFAF